MKRIKYIITTALIGMTLSPALAQNIINQPINNQVLKPTKGDVKLTISQDKNKFASSTVDNNINKSNLNDNQRQSLTEYNVTPGGLFYKYIEQGQSNKVAQIGDVATIHVEYRLGDSLIFTTAHINAEGEPVTEFLKAPQYRGDVNEGLLMMKPGDKMEFKCIVDSLAAQTNATLPAFVKSGDFATWTITMFDLKTADEYKKAQEDHKSLQAQKDDEIISQYLKKNKLNYIKSPAGVYIVIHEEGFDDSPVKGQKVTVNYTGKLLDGKVFDSNVDPQFKHVQPFTFTLLANQVIKGWDDAISMLRRKSKATLYIPSPLAYGSKSPSPDIPANSILVFDIEILDYK